MVQYCLAATSLRQKLTSLLLFMSHSIHTLVVTAWLLTSSVVAAILISKDLIILSATLFLALSILGLLFSVNSVQAFLSVVLFAVFIPLFSSFSSSLLSGDSIRFLSASKEILIGLLAALSALRLFTLRLKVTLFDSCLFIFAFCFFIGFLVSEESITARLVSVKDAMLIFVAYFAGRMLQHQNDCSLIERVTPLLRLIAAVSVISSLATLLFTTENWLLLKVDIYFQRKFEAAIFYEDLLNGLPPHFYTYITSDIRLARNVGPILDAPGLSRFLSFFFAYFYALAHMRFFSNGTLKTVEVLALLGIFLVQVSSLSRGGLLIDTIVVFFMFLHTPRFRYVATIIFVIVLTISILLIAAGDGNTMRHIDGFLSGFQGATWLGNGVGSGGQQVLNYASIETSATQVQESFAAAVIYQLGFAGIFSLGAACLASLLAAANHKIWQGKPPEIIALWLSSASVVFSAFFTSALANAAVSFYAVAVPFFIFGMLTTFLGSSKRRDVLK
jgi:hypothetical protein